jgi:hypothetical protein
MSGALVDLAFLSPELVEAILRGRQPVELTATRLLMTVEKSGSHKAILSAYILAQLSNGKTHIVPETPDLRPLRPDPL